LRPFIFKSGITVVWLYLVAILRLPHFVLTLELRSVKYNLNELYSLKLSFYIPTPPFSPGDVHIYASLHSVGQYCITLIIKILLILRSI
jgi:hypothetical protein